MAKIGSTLFLAAAVLLALAARPAQSQQFGLYNYDTNKQLIGLKQGAVINTRQFTGIKYNVGVKFPGVKHISYVRLIDNQGNDHREFEAPYTAVADKSEQEIKPAGSYTLSAEAFDSKDKSLKKASLKVSFTTTTSNPKVKFTLIDHKTQANVQELEAGSTAMNTLKADSDGGKLVNVLIQPVGVERVERVRVTWGKGIANFTTAGPHTLAPNGIDLGGLKGQQSVHVRVFHRTNGPRITYSATLKFKIEGVAASSSSSSSSQPSSAHSSSSQSSSSSSTPSNGKMTFLWGSSFEKGHPGGEWDTYQVGLSKDCSKPNNSNYAWCFAQVSTLGVPGIDGPTVYKGVIFGPSAKSPRPYPLKTADVGAFPTPLVNSWYVWMDWKEDGQNDTDWQHEGTWSCNKIWDVHTLTHSIDGSLILDKLLNVTYPPPRYHYKKRTWQRITTYLDYETQPGIIAAWVDGKLVAKGNGGNTKIKPSKNGNYDACGAGSLTQMHWGLYAGANIKNAVQLNDKIELWRLPAKLTNFDVEPKPPGY